MVVCVLYAGFILSLNDVTFVFSSHSSLLQDQMYGNSHSLWFLLIVTFQLPLDFRYSFVYQCLCCKIAVFSIISFHSSVFIKQKSIIDTVCVAVSTHNICHCHCRLSVFCKAFDGPLVTAYFQSFFIADPSKFVFCQCDCHSLAS